MIKLLDVDVDGREVGFLNERFLGRNFASFLQVTESSHFLFYETYCDDDDGMTRNQVLIFPRCLQSFFGRNDLMHIILLFKIMETTSKPRHISPPHPLIVCHNNKCVRCNNAHMSVRH